MPAPESSTLKNGVAAFGERPNSDILGRRELDRVTDQVGDHLLEPFRIAIDAHAASN